MVNHVDWSARSTWSFFICPKDMMELSAEKPLTIQTWTIRNLLWLTFAVGLVAAIAHWRCCSQAGDLLPQQRFIHSKHTPHAGQRLLFKLLQAI